MYNKKNPFFSTVCKKAAPHSHDGDTSRFVAMQKRLRGSEAGYFQNNRRISEDSERTGTTAVGFAEMRKPGGDSHN
jgi:hypothetical protein